MTRILDRKDVEAVYPLSAMQQGILFHSLESPDSAVYWNQLALTLRGPLDEGCFERAWQKVSSRHAAFRTAFMPERSVQIVFRRAGLPILKQDWREIPPEVQNLQLNEYLAQERRRQFRPAEVPLMRLALFRTGDREFQFVWSHHHILLDAWSITLVLKEVMAFYQAFSHGQDIDFHLPGPTGTTLRGSRSKTWFGRNHSGQVCSEM